MRTPRPTETLKHCENMPYATNTAFSSKQWASVLFHDERSPIFLLFRNADNLQPCISA